MSKKKPAITSAAQRSRRWREKYPEKNREAQRRWRKANPDKVAAHERNRKRDKAKTKARQRDWSLRMRHGGLDGDAGFAVMWEKQGGKCYLCGIYLVPEGTHIDHDHRCCPPGRSCQFCRRGLACDYCNKLIGLAHDDPDVLRLIAANLEAKLAEVDARLASKPRQMALIPGGAA